MGAGETGTPVVPLQVAALLFGRGGNLSVGSHPPYNLWGRALGTHGTAVEEVVLLVVRVDYANLALLFRTCTWRG